MECPACSHSEHTSIVSCSVYECKSCGAIHGQLYLGDSYRFVKPTLATLEVVPEKLCYFDFECVGSAGLSRRHGWYDPATKLIHQVG